MKNFVRIKSINDDRYMVTVRELEEDRLGDPAYYVQTWKMDKMTSGYLHMPSIKGWNEPSKQGYRIRAWNIEDSLESFLNDFKKTVAEGRK